MPNKNKKNNSLDQNKIEEYFQLKSSLKTIRRDLSEMKKEHEANDELKQLKEKAKLLKNKIKNDEEIYQVQQKLDNLNERIKLLKEIIKAELIQNNKNEVKREGRKLKIVPVLKEVKDEDDENNKSFRTNNI